MNSLINTKLNVPLGLLKNVGKMRLTLDESKKSGTLVAAGDENISTETKISSRGSHVALVPGRRSRANVEGVNAKERTSEGARDERDARDEDEPRFGVYPGVHSV